MYSKKKETAEAQTYFLNDSALSLVKMLGIRCAPVKPGVADIPEEKSYDSPVEIKKKDKVNFAAQSFPNGISGKMKNSFYIITIDLDAQIFKDKNVSDQTQALLWRHESDSCWYKSNKDKIYCLSFKTRKSAQTLLDSLQPLLPERDHGSSSINKIP
ncbi:MAG: hypothetical protein Q8M03_07925 [Legionella sp.]|nr:hypothetical protein [Legionella sp.]